MKLNVLKKNLLIQEIDLGRNVLAHDYSETIFLIGRSKDCHVVLDDKKISREHARIIHSNGQWFIEKTNPENICQVNAEDFDRHELEVGDSISIDKFVIEVKEINYERTSAISAPNPPVAEVKINQDPLQLKDSEEKAVENNIFESTKTDVNEVASDEGAIGNDDAGEINQDFLDNEQADSGDDSYDLGGHHDDGETPLQDEYADNQHIDGELIVDGEYNNLDENLPYAGDDDGYDEGTVILKSFISVHLELFGESAPYDKYVIEGDETFIGRDPLKCQIVLNDSEVSSVHAVLRKTNTTLMLEDLNSSNGTIHNGDRVNKIELHQNDEFVIGGVAFTVKFRSDFLKEENSTLMPVDENQMIEVEEVVEIHAEDDEEFDALGEAVENAPVEKSIIKRILKDDVKRKKAIYVLVALVVAFVLFYEPKPDAPPKTAKKAKSKEAPVNANKGKVQLTEEQMRSFSALYEIGKEHYNNGRYREALNELQKIAAVDPNFNPSLQSLIGLSKEGLSKLEELERERLAKIAAQEKKIKIEKLIILAREYTKDRRIDLAYSVFDDITKLDPENFEITKLKMELEDWKAEQQRVALEEAQKKKDREDKVARLQPGKTFYLQKEWFKAIGKLEDFLTIKEMDEDLTKEAVAMLKESKDQLEASIAPLVGKAKSLKEGQDLKGAYVVYMQILRIDPSHAESNQELGSIREFLTNRARKIYREAIISESLSLFQDAREKFQEVQQMSPVDSEYYIKATDKLRFYLD